MAGQGGTIYRDGKVKTETAQSNYSTSQLANNVFDNTDQLEGEARQEKSEAFSIYSHNMKALATENMGKAFQSYGNDPTKLSEELGKLKADMTKTMPDPKLKAVFMADYELQSSSYINQAQANFDKIQYEKKKSAIFDSIVNNDKAIGLSFSNSLRGTANGDDFVNFKRSMEQNKAMINSRNPDGTYMFSDSQRLSMSKNLDKQVSDSFENAYMEMPEYKRKQFMQNLANDNVTLMELTNANGTHKVMLQDTVDPTTYRDMKRKIQDLDIKERKRAIQEFNLTRSEAKVGFLQNPTEEGLKNLKALFPEMTESQEEKYQNALNSVSQDAVTEFANYDEALLELKALSSLPASTSDEIAELNNQAAEMLFRVRDANAKNQISADDLEEITANTIQTLTDKVFMAQLAEMPDMGVFDRLAESSRRWSMTDKTPLTDENMAKIDKSKIPMDTQLIEGRSSDTIIGKTFDKLAETGSRIRAITMPLTDTPQPDYEKKWYQKKGIDTMKKVIRVMQAGGAIEENGKRITAQDVYNAGMEEATRRKYKYLPEMSQPLIPNESTITVSGETYIFGGFSSGKVLLKEGK